MARALDAYDNILDEKGSDQDFIDFFRRARIDRPTAEAKGLLARRKGRDAFDVAEYASEDLYALAMGDARMDAPTAAAIAREAPVPHAALERAQGWNQNIQAAVSRAVLEDGLRADDAAIMARSLRQAYAQRIRERGLEQLDLFGNDDTFILAMTVEAKFAAQQIRQIDFDLRGLKTAAGKQSGNLAARDTLIRKYRLKGPEDREGMARAIVSDEKAMAFAHLAGQALFGIHPVIHIIELLGREYRPIGGIERGVRHVAQQRNVGLRGRCDAYIVCHGRNPNSSTGRPSHRATVAPALRWPCS